MVVDTRDSSGDLENLKAYIYLTKELLKEAVTPADNDGAVLTYLREGGADSIAGRANIWPRTPASIYGK